MTIQINFPTCMNTSYLPLFLFSNIKVITSLKLCSKHFSPTPTIRDFLLQNPHSLPLREYFLFNTKIST